MDTSPKLDVILARKQVVIDSQGDQESAPEKPPLDPSDWHPTFTEGCERVKNKLRVVRVIHHKELSPLRIGEHLLRSWRGCFEYHYALWKGGIEHGDISPRFLKVGVLNDFDLTNIPGEDSRGGRRTGTIAFMALQLIDRFRENPRRFYRHDVESLIWVLIWICLDYREHGDAPQGMKEEDVQKTISFLQSWKTGDTEQAFHVRTAFFLRLKTVVPRNASKELWNLANKLGTWVKRMNDHETVEGLDCTEEVEVIHKQIVIIIKEYESRDRKSVV